jgi:peptide/nickel transport system substrate-binding protein
MRAESGRGVSRTAAGLAALALVLGACGATEPSPPETAGPAEPSPTVAGEPDVEPDVPSGGLPIPRSEAVVVDTDTTYTTFDGANLFIPEGSQWGSGYHQVVNEWSWYLNYATGETINHRIEGWEYSDDFTTFTLNIREGVTWNDGEPFTANDIVFTIEMLLEGPELIGHSVADEWVESAEAPDELTAVIQLKKPNPRFEHQFRMWGGPLGQTVAQHVWEGQDPTTFRNWPPVETGPYQLQGVYEDFNMFVWERRDDYWGEELGISPGPRYVVYRTAPPPDINLQEVVEGEVDAPLPHVFPWHLVEAARAVSDDVVIASFLDPNPVGIYGFNVNDPLLQHREARWAVAMLLNREKLAELYPAAESSVVSPYPWPAPDWESMDRFTAMAESAMERIEAEDGFRFEYDPEAAGQILDELGYTLEGDARMTPDGEPLSLVLLTRPATLQEEFYVAEDLAAELRAIGVDATIKSVDPGAYFDTMRDGAFDIAVGWIEAVPSAFASDIVFGLDWWRWKEAEIAADPLKDQLTFNNPELDEVVDQLNSVGPDDPAAEALYEEGIYLLMREMLAAPAVEKAFVQAFSTQHWTGWPTDDDMYHVPYNWWPEFSFVLSEIEPRE